VTAAWVGGRPLEVADVDAREALLRAGLAGAALPAAGTSEGRQLRRWLVQLLVAERLVADEAEARGLSAAQAPDVVDFAPDRAAALELGSIAASLLASTALARAVFAAVTAHITVDERHVARFHADNPELFHHQEARVVRHVVLTTPNTPADLDDRPPRTIRRGELVGPVERALFEASPGTEVGPIHDPLGAHVLRVEQVLPARRVGLDEARPGIVARLRAAARRREFATWLDRGRAMRVRLAPGYEHPGDPSQPDNTHRH
jgi:[acyl-carrier-protein] S-malonyltransferase